jgi:2,3-bisphosphoglycerate-independent phosphoglycerate mutase
MKYIIIVPDGMADYKYKELGGKTPMEYADTPAMDSLSGSGIMGVVRTVPAGFSPGSDIANLSIMGYDPRVYHKGRSPLEAVSIGIEPGQDDVIFRCNLVTLSNESDYHEKTMIDYSTGEISTEDSAMLIEYLKSGLETEDIRFYSGVSYRNIMVWKGGPYKTKLTPPHDILEKKIAPYLPSGTGSKAILELMLQSSRMLQVHPLNRSRIDRGYRPANSIWLWGQGKKPYLVDFYDKYGLKGSVIAAVDLIRGIGICAGLEVVEVDGITGTINTNLAGKAKAAADELLSGKDFVYVHIEAPDECSHQGSIEDKIKIIEMIDREVVGYIQKVMDKSGMDYRIMVLPDHYTPVSLRTHTSRRVPFLIFDSTDIKTAENRKIAGFSEKAAASEGIIIDRGHLLIDVLLQNKTLEEIKKH